MELQKTFKESYSRTLKENVKTGVSIPLYRNDEFDVDGAQVKHLARVYKPEGLEDKLLDTVDDDFKSGIALYEAYNNISPLLASNETFWVYLTHTELYHYVQHRWPKVFEDGCGSNYILDHWFVSSQGLLRNACASLWWSVHNTIDDSRENQYELTEILFRNYTLRTVTLGAYPLIRHKEAMIGILSFLKDNKLILELGMEDRCRFIAKYFNRLGAVKQLTYLNRDFFYNVCSQMKDKIMYVTSRDQLSDDSLYNDTIK